MALLALGFTAALRSDVPTPFASLVGAWNIKSLKLNGRDHDDRQFQNGQLTFTERELLFEPGDGSAVERFKIEPQLGSSPSALLLTRIVSEAPDDPDAQQGWMIYEVDGLRLRIAMYEYMHDIPESFQPTPHVIVLELEKAK